MASHDYRLLIDLKSLQQLPRSGKRRPEILNFFQELETNAEFGGDFEVIDPESMRPFQVSIVAGFAIT